jgi:hypothetical protein
MRRWPAKEKEKEKGKQRAVIVAKQAHPETGRNGGGGGRPQRFPKKWGGGEKHKVGRNRNSVMFEKTKRPSLTKEQFCEHYNTTVVKVETKNVKRLPHALNFLNFLACPVRWCEFEIGTESGVMKLSNC